jgi:hypothetical protein
MTRLLAFVFSAILLAGVGVQEASARRGGIHVGSADGPRGGLRARGYRAATWGRPGADWRWFGFGVGRGAVADVVGPGTCGTYLYWKDGKCVDARGK